MTGDIIAQPLAVVKVCSAVRLLKFRVVSRLRVEWVQCGLGGIRLTEEPVNPPYEKDYDSFEGERPLRWGKRWDISNWGVLLAYDGQELVGGGVVAWKTPGSHMLEGRDDLAVLWDIRVRPERRGQGIGRRLMDRAASWARDRQCRWMKIETQNTNVPACRFYAACGCRLGGVRAGAYAELPDEVMLVWYLDLGVSCSSES